MTTKEVKKAAEIMLAFADGAEIQYSHKGQNNWLNWINESSPSFDWQTFDYRIKPEPKYRPFKTIKECLAEMLRHSDIGYILYKADGKKEYIEIGPKGINYMYGNGFCGYDIAFEIFTFTDGEPFGIKEE